MSTKNIDGRRSKKTKKNFVVESCIDCARKDHFLIEIWGLLNLYFCQDTRSIGLNLWSDCSFIDPPMFIEEVDTAIYCTEVLEIKSTEDVIVPQDLTIVCNDSCNGRKVRKAVMNSKTLTINQLCHLLSKADIDPHLLVTPQISDESMKNTGLYIKKQAFKIRVHPQVSMLCDVHSHLCEAEVIGLLAGKWDANGNCLYVQAAFPCTSTSRESDGDDGSTDVELDPEAEIKVREIIHSLGMQVVGWYHSHPKFRPDPSVTDIFNQQQYQVLKHYKLLLLLYLYIILNYTFLYSFSN
jgi:proteasome lid subunit RPN8/RPN11